MFLFHNFFSDLRWGSHKENHIVLANTLQNPRSLIGYRRECCSECGGTDIFSSWCFVSFGCTPRSGIARSYGSSIFSFWGISILFPIVAAPFTLSPVHKGSLPSTVLPTLVVFLFDDSHSSKCGVISHGGFNFICLVTSGCWTFFHMPVGLSHIFL